MKRLLITSGSGPAECRIGVAMALWRLGEEATEMGLDFAAVEGPRPDAWGPVSGLATLYGEGAELLARRWLGTILWTIESPVRPHHKRRNWFVGVFDSPEIPAAAPLDPAEVRFEAFRAGGPGGQHQNVTDSAVRAIHLPTGLAVVAREERSQHRNKAAALARLGEMLAGRAVLAAAAARRQDWLAHKSLERGAPVRRFKGARFLPEGSV